MDALLFIVDSLLSIAVYLFLIRLLLQLLRGDFRNPLSQAILRLTNWLVMPLRRILPPIGRIDTASVVAALLVQVVAIAAVFTLSTGAGMPVLPLLVASAKALLIATIQLFTFAVFIYALLSLIAPGTYSPAVGLLASLCEPLLRPVRSALPAIAGLDFSPLVVILGLQALKILIQ